MKTGIRLSINPLADFATATQSKKERIIQAQKMPNPVIVSWYKGAKSVMRSYYQNPMDVSVIEKGLKKLKDQKPQTKWQTSNRQGSIEILERFIRMSVPKCFKDENIEFIKPAMKSVMLHGVEVITSPELVFRVFQNDMWRYGAVKFHTSKSGKFDRDKARIVSTVLKLYLNRYTTEYDSVAEVAPEYCLSVDVFNEIISNANNDTRKTELIINEACSEVIKLWDAA